TRHDWWHFKKVVGAFPATAEPPGVASDDHLKNTCWPVPRKGNVAFIIAVVDQQIALRAEVKVIGVAKSIREDLTVGKIRGESQQRARLGQLDRRHAPLSVSFANTRVIARQKVPGSFWTSAD